TLTYTDVADGASAPNFTVTGTASNGSASIDNTTGDWTYTPDADFNGTDSFTVTVTDDDGNSQSQVVNITVSQVDDAGSFGGDTSGSGSEDGGAVTGTLTYTDVADGVTNPDFTVTAAAANGTAVIDSATGDWTYTPSLNFNGTDSFTVTVSDDDGNPQTQVISITINSVNDAPSIGSTPVTAATEDVAYSYTVTTSDVDGDTPSLTATTLPVWLTLTDNGDGTATLTGMPTSAEVGDHSVVIEASDGSLSATQSFTIAVANTNDAPTVATVELGSINEDGDRLITQAELLAGSSDADGDSLSAVNLSLTTGSGTLSDNGDGTWTFRPSADWNGAVSFGFEVTDGTIAVANAASLTVTAVNDVPTTSGLADQNRSEDFADYTIDLKALFADVETSDTNLTYTVSGNSDIGVSIDVNGVATISPTANWNGTETITFTARDENGASVDVTANFVVAPVNDAPSIRSTPITSATEDVAYHYTLTTHSPDGDALIIDASELPTWMRLTDHGDGTATLSGTPTTAHIGDHAVRLNVTDGALSSGQHFVLHVSAGAPGNAASGTHSTGGATSVTPPVAEPNDLPTEPAEVLNNDNEVLIDLGTTGTEDEADTAVLAAAGDYFTLTEAGGSAMEDGPASIDTDEAGAGGDPQVLHATSVTGTLEEKGSVNHRGYRWEPPLKGEAGDVTSSLQWFKSTRAATLFSSHANLHDDAPTDGNAANDENDAAADRAVTEKIMASADLNRLHEELDEAYSTERGAHTVKVRVATTMMTTFTVGFVTYLLRAGSLVAGMMSTLPLWRGFDPIAVFAGGKKKAKKQRQAASETESKSETLFDEDAP
nr:tandem-95 repeat protein [Desulfosarcinaceae bacterium]